MGHRGEGNWVFVFMVGEHKRGKENPTLEG